MAIKVLETPYGVTAIALILTLGCLSGGSGPEGPVESTRQALGSGSTSNANLQLQVLTNSCGANQAQQFFQIVNNSGAAAKLSDLQVKFWINDTSANTAVAASINYPGCVANAGNPSCVHPVSASKTMIETTRLSSSCGPDANHQANWEIAISFTDTYAIPAGGALMNLQAALNLANYGNFNPGSSKWYSPCVSGTSYATNSHFSLYYQGKLVTLNGVTAPDCQAPHGTQQLAGHLTPEVTSAPVVGPVPANTLVRLAVTLPLRNPDVLDDFIKQASDPTSPNYRQHLTPELYNTNHAPSQQDYDSLVAWAALNGLQVDQDYSHRLALSVSGTAANIARALYLGFNYFRRPDGSTFFAPDREPSIDLATAGVHIAGLQNYHQSRPTVWMGPPHGPQAGTNPDSILVSASDLRRMYYNCPSAPAASELDGSGQAIGIFSGAFYNRNDIASYFTSNATSQRAANANDAQLYSNLAANLATQLIDVPVAGDPNNCLTEFSPSGCGDPVEILETTMDIEVALSMAPKAKVYVFSLDLSASKRADTPLTTILAKMAEYNGTNGRPFIGQFSISRSAVAEDATDFQRLQGLVDTMAGYRQSVFLASGDYGGSNGPYCGDPKSCSLGATAFVSLKHVTLVGGTQLSPAPTTSAAISYDEAAWNTGGGGGESEGGVLGETDQPDYQYWMNVLLPSGGTYIGSRDGSTLKRNFPDVAGLADGIWILTSCDRNECYAQPKMAVGGGTSAAAPMWAGFMALANQKIAGSGLKTAGFINPLVYALGKTADIPAPNDLYAQSFNDTKIGDTFVPNPWGSAKDGFSTFPGYDLATGWGSPKCGFIERLSSAVPAPEVAVSVGVRHACAIRYDGSVSCWGSTESGQLGNPGASNPQLSPLAVAGWAGKFASYLAAGGSHTCTVLTDGNVWCWGKNQNGEFGNGTNSDANTPVQTGFSNSKTVAAGSSHICALATNGFVKCAGRNNLGQLGNGESTDSATPVTVLDGPRQTNLVASAIAVAGNHGCAITGSDSRVLCWGQIVPHSLVWTSSAWPPYSSPDGHVLTGATAIAAASLHNCAVIGPAGTVECWGSDGSGELGDMGDLEPNDPRPPANRDWPDPKWPVLSCADYLPLSNVVSISVGADVSAGFSCALMAGGTVQCWGSNYAGQLGDGTNEWRGCAAPVKDLTGVTQISAGDEMACARTAGGLWCWGTGVLGDGTAVASNVPVLVKFL